MKVTEIIASLACRALLYEVCTTPKPGLVDREGSGSHKDMDIFTFMDSASVLWPYFEECARAGIDTARRTPSATFRAIRSVGMRAECEMLAATHGVNTHKGAIFSVGIMCAALGRMDRTKWCDPASVLAECAAMTKGLTEADFAGLTRQNARTVGQKLYLEYGITGVRGQMEAGLPAVKEVGLPVLKEGIAHGLSVNDAGCAALLALITASVDTNIIARSDVATQQRVVEKLKALLKDTKFPDADTIRRIGREFVRANLSPGGSADLLAICYMLYFLESGAHTPHI